MTTRRYPRRPGSAGRPAVFERADHDRVFHRDFRDHLGYAFAADTLFAIGSRRAFELDGDEVRRGRPGPVRRGNPPLRGDRARPPYRRRNQATVPQVDLHEGRRVTKDWTTP